MKKTAAKKEWLEVFDSDSDFEWVSPQVTKSVKADTEMPAVKKETTSSGPAQYMAEYILELAKSGRAECKKCNLKIAKDELRVGVVVQGDRW